MHEQPVSLDFSRLFAALQCCVLVHDSVSKDILWANPAACDVLGFTLDELKPLKAPDMSSNAHQYAREIGVDWLQRAADHGSSSIEWCYRSKAGENILTEAIAFRVELAQGPVVMVQFRDIAAEQATRLDLLRTESRLQTFLRNLDEGIVVLDDDARVLYASSSAGSLLHLEAEQLTGGDFTRFCDEESAAALREVLAMTERDGPPTDGQYRLRTADGRKRWFAGRWQYIDIESDLRGLLLLFHDITDRVQVEEEHRRDAQYLNYLARYNAMGDMAMAIAHEVSQPIAAAHNFVAGVRGRLGGGADHEALDWGLKNATLQIDRAAQILSSLRQYVVRLEQSEQLIDLNDIVTDCLYFIDVRARQSEVAVAWLPSTDPLPVRCDKVLIGQVVMNLAFNAIEEMTRWPADRRSVTVSTARNGSLAELTVRDLGQGLTAFPDGLIFDGAFTSKENGSGIGLALSHRIITRHHGTIHAAENSPRGAAFSFALPLLSE
ncbi:PAS domain S-box protein [Streptomyces sp. NPDC090052]|uniref:PAS domain S-box protein n=1 Tax=unclassified Streptomyces TaxID=2593676 RepID=UPI0022580650|nr:MULTISPECIES: PAS domain S-box protein [unclassified Streptomyces]MCX4728099.1 PAS domain S-box protein [Streptomyces sp. NBC_01306]WSV02675.1 PAS domain S-box protein [Streptomyces sp. NBC_01020]WSX40745.1 PAS domain S-box protein [Streptomyces sp. NBC_00963]WSX71287.1 PAS domain S-box protein [Streptomyces sp. NBC_00932]